MAKTLSNFPTYYQVDGKWDSLCTTKTDFKNYGCGICCAAMITQYKEGGIKSPAIMQQRGVFTRSNLTTMWGNSSKKFSWGGQEYSGNLKGALVEIKNQIDRYSDPMVLRIEGSYQHFVVAYGYTGNCTSANDVLIKDPMRLTTTLGGALASNRWPRFLYLKRII